MRVFVASLVLGIMLVSVASAELLTTAMPLGQGTWAVEGAGMQDANVNNNTSYNMTTIGGYVGYGVTDKLDAYLQYGAANVGGLPVVAGTQIAQSMSAIGLNGKYTIMDEMSGTPVSVAIGAGYKAINSSTTMPAFLGGNSTNTGSQIMVGVGVSKLMVPFIPYAGVDYRSNTFSSGGGAADSTQLDLTIGTAIAWSVKGAAFVEYTMQSITPNTASGVANHTSGQIGVGVAYKI